MNYKKIIVTLMLSTSIFGSVITIPVQAAGRNHLDANLEEVEQTPDVFISQFQNAVEKVAIVKKDGEFVQIQNTATLEQDIKSAYKLESTIIMGKIQEQFTDSQKSLFDNLRTSLSRTSVIHQDNLGYENIKNQLDSLYKDKGQSTFIESVTERQLLNIFQNFLEFQERTHDISSNTQIEHLSQQMEGAINLWLSNLQTSIEKLFEDNSHTKLASGITKDQLELLSQKIKNLSNFNIDINTIKNLQEDLQKAYSELGNQPIAAAQEKATTIIYNGDEDIPDPDHPFDPMYMVSTPGNVTFTDKNNTFTGQVTMNKVNADGDVTDELYTGDGEGTVEVKSDNKLDLDIKAGGDKVAYDFMYASKSGDAAKLDKKLDKDTSGDFQKLFDIGSTKNSYNVRYKMTGKATKKGAHTDTLTYRVTSTKEATTK